MCIWVCAVKCHFISNPPSYIVYTHLTGGSKHCKGGTKATTLWCFMSVKVARSLGASVEIGSVTGPKLATSAGQTWLNKTRLTKLTAVWMWTSQPNYLVHKHIVIFVLHRLGSVLGPEMFRGQTDKSIVVACPIILIPTLGYSNSSWLYKSKDTSFCK